MARSKKKQTEEDRSQLFKVGLNAYFDGFIGMCVGAVVLNARADGLTAAETRKMLEDKANSIKPVRRKKK
jgi:hypothetical protein